MGLRCAGPLEDLAEVVGADRPGWEDLDALAGCSDVGREFLASFGGGGGAAGGEDAAKALGGEGIERLEGGCSGVEGPMEDEVEVGGGLGPGLEGLAVEVAGGREGADGCTLGLGGGEELEVARDGVDLGLGVDEVAGARSDEDDEGQVGALERGGDGALAGGEAADVECLAEFDAVGACALCGGAVRGGLDTDFEQDRACCVHGVEALTWRWALQWLDGGRGFAVTCGARHVSARPGRTRWEEGASTCHLGGCGVGTWP